MKNSPSKAELKARIAKTKRDHEAKMQAKERDHFLQLHRVQQEAEIAVANAEAQMQQRDAERYNDDCERNAARMDEMQKTLKQEQQIETQDLLAQLEFQHTHMAEAAAQFHEKQLHDETVAVAIANQRHQQTLEEMKGQEASVIEQAQRFIETEKLGIEQSYRQKLKEHERNAASALGIAQDMALKSQKKLAESQTEAVKKLAQQRLNSEQRDRQNEQAQIVQNDSKVKVAVKATESAAANMLANEHANRRKLQTALEQKDEETLQLKLELRKLQEGHARPSGGAEVSNPKSQPTAATLHPPAHTAEAFHHGATAGADQSQNQSELFQTLTKHEQASHDIGATPCSPGGQISGIQLDGNHEKDDDENDGGNGSPTPGRYSSTHGGSKGDTAFGWTSTVYHSLSTFIDRETDPARAQTRDNWSPPNREGSISKLVPNSSIIGSRYAERLVGISA